MDSSSVADGELRIQILKLSVSELAVWVFERADDVLLATGSPEEADEFRNHLCGRLSDELTPEQDSELAAALFEWHCGTEVDSSGNRIVLSRAERRRKKRDLQKKVSRKVASAEATTGTKQSIQQHFLRPGPSDGMTVDANGQLLMSSAKLADILVLRQCEKFGFPGMNESGLLRETSFEPRRVPDAEEVYRQTQ